MFSKKKNTEQIDPQQRELYENARKRIIQRKRLFRHFIVFVVGILFSLIFMLLGYGKESTILGLNWFVIGILAWSFLFVIHCCNVWLFNAFMGKEWTDRQMERLIAKQKQEIVLIQKDVDLMYPKEELIKKKEGFIKDKMNKVTNTK